MNSHLPQEKVKKIPVIPSLINRLCSSGECDSKYKCTFGIILKIHLLITF